MRTARVFRLSMAHPSDLSELDHLIAAGTISASEVAAIIGKTEGNGGVNDFTRGYFTHTLMALLSRHLNRPSSQFELHAAGVIDEQLPKREDRLRGIQCQRRHWHILIAG